MNTDIHEMHLLKEQKPNKLGIFDVEIDKSFFTKTTFSISTVNTKTFILMLANEGSLNFISGSPITLEPVLRSCNKREFHHVFPKKFLSDSGFSNNRINALTNFVLLSKADNNKLGGVAPSVYRKRMPTSEEPAL